MQTSANTQAILLLTAPLIVGRQGRADEVLTNGEYKKLARRLRELDREPGDLLGAEATAILKEVEPVVPEVRLSTLLARGLQLGQAIEHWQKRAIWVLSRADAEYPKHLKARCKEDAPPVLYGCGDPNMLDEGGLAVVGSRDVTDELREFAEHVGSLAAQGNLPIVSGGAKGIDRAAMGGVLMEGGKSIGVLSDSLERAAMARDNREFLMDGSLVLVSPFDPSAGFNVGNAMQRNKYIYALADAALVVRTDFKKGGTWSGAEEQLRKYHYVPVYVKDDQSEGMNALIKMGAQVCPEQMDIDFLRTALERSPSIPAASSPPELSLPMVSEAAGQPAQNDETSDVKVRSRPENGNGKDARNAEVVYSTVKGLVLPQIDQPKTETEIAEDLGVTPGQAREWLKRMAQEGLLKKTSRPVRYQRSSTQPDLFSSST